MLRAFVAGAPRARRDAGVAPPVTLAVTVLTSRRRHVDAFDDAARGGARRGLRRRRVQRARARAACARAGLRAMVPGRPSRRRRRRRPGARRHARRRDRTRGRLDRARPCGDPCRRPGRGGGRGRRRGCQRAPDGRTRSARRPAATRLPILSAARSRITAPAVVVLSEVSPMPLPPALTPEQRTLRSRRQRRRGECERRSRPELKLDRWRSATSSTRATRDDIVAKLKVVSVLESLPGVGKVRARRIMAELDISESRRLRGLGAQAARRAARRLRRPVAAAQSLAASCSSSPAPRGSARAPSSHALRARDPTLGWSVSATRARPRPARSTASTTASSPATSSSACATPAASSSGSRSTATSRARPAAPVEAAPGRRRRRAPRDRRAGGAGGPGAVPRRAAGVPAGPRRRGAGGAGCRGRGTDDPEQLARRLGRPATRRPWRTGSTPSWSTTTWTGRSAQVAAILAARRPAHAVDDDRRPSPEVPEIPHTWPNAAHRSSSPASRTSSSGWTPSSRWSRSSRDAGPGDQRLLQPAR